MSRTALQVPMSRTRLQVPMSRTPLQELDLATIRHELDILVVARRGGELSPPLYLRYMELCRLESDLLKVAS